MGTALHAPLTLFPAQNSMSVIVSSHDTHWRSQFQSRQAASQANLKDKTHHFQEIHSASLKGMLPERSKSEITVLRECFA